MIGLYIIGGPVLLALLIGLMPLQVTGEYSGDGAKVKALVGPLTVWQYPRVKGEKTKKPKKHKKAQPTQKPEKTRKEKPEEKGEKPGGRLPLFRELLGLVMELQGALRNRLVLRELTLHLTLGGKGDDPAMAAVLYGSAWAAIGGLMPVLERSFQIKSRDIQAQVDFLQEETTVYARAAARISLGALLRMAVYYGLRGLKLYRTHRKKGGKENGTSHQ